VHVGEGWESTDGQYDILGKRGSPHPSPNNVRGTPGLLCCLHVRMWVHSHVDADTAAKLRPPARVMGSARTRFFTNSCRLRTKMSTMLSEYPTASMEPSPTVGRSPQNRRHSTDTMRKGCTNKRTRHREWEREGTEV
jgi:hypothetical protein